MQTTPLDPSTVPYTFITSTEQALAELADLRTADAVAADTETEILYDEDGKPIKLDFDVDGPGPWRVMSIAARFGDRDNGVRKTWVLDMLHVDPVALNAVFDGVRPRGWNVRFDRKVCTRAGLNLRYWWDGMIAEATLHQGAVYRNGGRPFYTGLDAAARTYLGMTGIEGKSDTRTSYTMRGELTEEQKRYAADDALVTLEVLDVIMDIADQADLRPTATRGMLGETFISAMGTNGLALDVEAYRGLIAKAEDNRDEAAARVAMATDGADLVGTFARWDAKDRGLPAPGALGAEQLLAIMDDLEARPGRFQDFLNALRAQLEVCRGAMANLTGASATADLFSDNVHFSLPFDPDDEASLKKWISKTLPVFTAEFIASVGTSNKQLVKAHDINAVYAALATAPDGEVTDEHRELALVLASYRRYATILEQYGTQVGALRVKPGWKLGSGEEVKAALNRYAADRIAAYTQAKDGYAHLLGKADAVDSDALSLIGGELAEAMLAWREHEKTVSTYGENWLAWVHKDTGRVHGKYQQELTGTGRLNSHSPNMQNASIIKPFAYPARDAFGRVTRVHVQVDLSQAELRYVASASEDIAMLTAFRSGKDLHVVTASLMFSVDLSALKPHGDTPLCEVTGVDGLAPFAAAEPLRKASSLFKELRSKAKAVAFGYAYGLKAAALAKQLTVNGVPTIKDEAQALLDAFDVAYPQLAAWMAARAQFIADLAGRMRDQSTPSGADFEASWFLHTLYPKVIKAENELKNELGRRASDLEVAEKLMPLSEVHQRLEQGGQEITDDAVAAVRTNQVQTVAWARSQYGCAVLAEDGSAWAFESRTGGGRRRLFQVSTKDWVWQIVNILATSRRTNGQQLRDAWVASWNTREEARVAELGGRGKAKTVALTKRNVRTGRIEPLSRDEIKKALEDEAMRNDFAAFVIDAVGQGQQGSARRDYLFRQAMSEAIKAMGNRYRNHPIQGGVADAVIDAYAVIDQALTQRFPSALAVQSVHDSIVVECDIQDALAVRDLIKEAMEAALAVYCPLVPCVADGDITTSLHEDDKLSDEQVMAMVSELALAA